MIVDKYQIHNDTDLRNHPCDPTWLSSMEISFIFKRKIGEKCEYLLQLCYNPDHFHHINEIENVP